jgi:hypothetical protein
MMSSVERVTISSGLMPTPFSSTPNVTAQG